MYISRKTLLSSCLVAVSMTLGAFDAFAIKGEKDKPAQRQVAKAAGKPKGGDSKKARPAPKKADAKTDKPKADKKKPAPKKADAKADKPAANQADETLRSLTSLRQAMDRSQRTLADAQATLQQRDQELEQARARIAELEAALSASRQPQGISTDTQQEGAPTEDGTSGSQGAAAPESQPENLDSNPGTSSHGVERPFNWDEDNIASYQASLAEKAPTDPHQRSVLSDEDYLKGAITNLPGWTGCHVLKEAPLADGQEPIYWTMAKHGDPEGFEPRHLSLNARLPLADPFRHAILNLSFPIPQKHEWKRMYEDKAQTKVHQAVADYMAIRFYKEAMAKFGVEPIVYSAEALRNPEELKRLRGAYRQYALDKIEKFFDESIDKYDGSYHPFATKEDPTGKTGAAAFAKQHNLTFEKLFLADPFNDTPKLNGYDANGVPLTENPHAGKIRLSGPGFYFMDGENLAVDAIIRVKGATPDEEDRYILIERKGEKRAFNDGTPEELASVGGMPDKFESGSRNVALELAQEVGLGIDFDQLKNDGKLAQLMTTFVAAEPRQTQTAGTVTKVFGITLDANDLDRLRLPGGATDTHEVSRVALVPESYLLAMLYKADHPETVFRVDGEEVNLPTFFASHASLYKAMLGSKYKDGAVPPSPLTKWNPNWVMKKA